MLVEIKKLLVENDGYNRSVSLQRMYINSNNIVSISDYHGARKFLLSENSRLSTENFSLVKINEGGTVDSVIALGTSKQLYNKFNSSPSGKTILND